MTKTAKQLIASKTKKPTTKKPTLQSYLAQGRPVTPDSIGYILRCNAPDLTSKNQFQWVTQGPVEAPDWKPTNSCGNGLHGWLWGEGNHMVSDHWANPKAVWLVAAVWLADVIDLKGKVKFPRAWVVYSGTRDEATREIVKLGSKKPVMFVNLTAGDDESQVGGFQARLTGGYNSTNTDGDYSTNTGGDDSVNTGGTGSTNTGGDWSTNKGGNNSTLIWKIWDGTRYRLHTYYTGEDGILPNVPYKWIDGKPVAQK
jgi:hypothetical protein